MIAKSLTLLRMLALLAWAFASGAAYVLLSVGYNPHHDPMHGREHRHVTQKTTQTQVAPDGSRVEVVQEITQEGEIYPPAADRFSRATGASE